VQWGPQEKVALLTLLGSDWPGSLPCELQLSPLSSPHQSQSQLAAVEISILPYRTVQRRLSAPSGSGYLDTV